MLNDIDIELRKLKEEIALKGVLQNKYNNLEAQLERTTRELYDLEKTLNREYDDVEKLKSITLTNLIATIMKNKHEKLDKEQQEYLKAKLEYDECNSSVQLMKDEMANIEKRLDILVCSENKYNRLLKEKSDLIKKSGEDIEKRNKLVNLEDGLDNKIKEKKEIEEAEYAGQNLLIEIEAAEKSLNSARNWGAYDIFGGGIISSMEKHNRIAEAKERLNKISYQITRFNNELGDVDIDSISFSETTIVVDIFFDNIFTDISVQNKINQALGSVVTLKSMVENILIRLDSEKQKVCLDIECKQREYDEVVEKF